MSTGSADADLGWRPRHNPWAIALTVTMATFMEVLDTSIANVALPHIAGGLSAGADEATWVLTSYLVSNAVVLPISAWLSDRFGRKRFYMTCVAIFTLSSFLCGLAPSLSALILFRVMQGVGGGGLAPSEQAILADTFEPAKRGMAFAIYGMAVVLAPAIGPTLGGFITDHFSWRWIFYINVPVGLLSLFLTSRMVEDPPHLVRAREEARHAKVDFVGLGLIACGLGCLQVVLDKGQEDDWFGSQFILRFAIAAFVTIALFIIWELRQDHPVLKLRLLTNPSFAAANILMFALGGMLFGTTVLIPQFLQMQMHWSATQAGMTLSAGGFVVLLILPIVGRVVGKIDARKLVAFGFLASGLALIHMTNLYLGIDFVSASWFRALQSIGIAFLFVPINTLAYQGIANEDNNQVSGMVNLSRNMGGSVGISAVTTMLARRAQFHQHNLAWHLSSGDLPFARSASVLARRITVGGLSIFNGQAQAYGRMYRTLQGQAQVLAYIDTIQVFAIACLVMVPIAFIARRAKPGEVHMGH